MLHIDVDFRHDMAKVGEIEKLTAFVHHCQGIRASGLQCIKAVLPQIQPPLIDRQVIMSTTATAIKY